MKAALIHDWLTGMRGGEKVLEVLCELFPDADLYTLLHNKGSVSNTIECMKIKTSYIQNLPFAYKKYRNYLPLFPAAIEQFDLRYYDLIISASHCAAKGVIPSPHTCHISYIHTPMRYIWDMHYEYFQDKGRMSRAIISLFANYLRMWDVASSSRVDYFIANSYYVAKRIEKYYNRVSEVIYPPVDVDSFTISERDTGDYYLIVSAFAPYKRLDIAIKAFNELRIPLKIIGSGQNEKKLKNIAGSYIEFLGWQQSSTIKDYYAQCKAVIFPGEEDFGIVPLEAMACGKPVIAYGKGGVLETMIPLQKDSINQVSDTACCTGLFFYEQTPNSLCEGIRLFQKNQHLFDKKKIREHALRFGREVFKEKIKNFIDDKYKEFTAGLTT